MLCSSLLSALLHTDTSDCLLFLYPPSSNMAAVLSTISSTNCDSILLPPVLYDMDLVLQYDLLVLMYNMHLRATHTTTSDTRGNTDPYLVSH